MRPARIILIVIALVAGGLAALLVTRMGHEPAPSTEIVTQVVEEAKTEVLVARRAIGVGERLAIDTVEWQSWPEGALRPEYVTVSAMPDAPTKLAGAVARFEFFPGEPIREQKLVNADQGYLSAVLSTGMRGVSVAVSAASSAGGFIVPNDHVDVILTTSGAAGQQSEVVLSNVRVLAIGHRLGEMGGSGGDESGDLESPQPTAFDDRTIATLELNPVQAETLVNASMLGQLTLTLRSVADFANSGDILRTAGSQSVRVIRFGKEQNVLAEAGTDVPTVPADYDMTPAPDLVGAGQAEIYSDADAPQAGMY